MADMNSLLSSLAALQNPEAAKKNAMQMGLLSLGAGILANNRGNYGALGPALGAGVQSALPFVQQYQNANMLSNMMKPQQQPAFPTMPGADLTSNTVNQGLQQANPSSPLPNTNLGSAINSNLNQMYQPQPQQSNPLSGINMQDALTSNLNEAIGGPAYATALASWKAYHGPTRLGEGAYADPQGNIIGLPNQAPIGYINQKDQNGNWQTVPVNNSLNAATTSKGALTSAEEQNKYVQQKMADGSTRWVRAGDIVGNSITPQYPTSSTPNQTPQNTDPWSMIPKMQVPKGVGQGTFMEQVLKGKGEQAQKLSETFGNLANDANTRQATNNQALELIDKSDTGPGASVIADMKNILVSRFGVPESDFQNSPSAYQALNKDLVNSALQRGRQLFGARFTQSEVGIMLTKAAPAPVQTKTAMKFLLNSDNAQLNYQINQANDLGKYLENGGDPSKFEGWYAKNFPLSKQLQKVQLNVQPTNIQYQQTATNPQTGAKMGLRNGQWEPITQ